MKKKIFIVAPNPEFDFIIKMLLNQRVIFCSPKTSDDMINNEDIPNNIIANDLYVLKNGGFNAQVFQSVCGNIPTRLLIPDAFSELELWMKEYSILHEIGHYFSIDKKDIKNYYSFLEKNKLYGQLYNIPLEIEAEKYVYKNNKKLFKRNADQVYLNYYTDLKNNIHKIKNNFFEQVFEIRFYRYYAIIENVPNKKSKFYKKHKKKIKKIRDFLSNEKEAYKEIVEMIDNFDSNIYNFFNNNDFQLYINYCDSVYVKNTKTKNNHDNATALS